MRVTTSLNSAYATEVRDGATRMVERARAAYASGLEGLYLGDHHATPVPYYQNSPMLGRLAAEWPDRRFGALYLLPLWHPLIVAEQVGTGTFVFQCAIGGGQDQFGPMGVDLSDRVRRFEEGLPRIRALLAGEEVDGARIQPAAAGDLEIWVGGAGSKALARAARLGDTWYAGPELTDAIAAEKLAEYLGHGPTPPCLPIRRDVYVGADEDDVARVRGPLEANGYRGFDLDAVVTGTVQQVAERFLAIGELGFDEVVVRQLAPDQGDAVASIERLAEVVALVGRG
jgi:alkanesulfonate monooxygenase SsuD/methylene tetrahydromethanopterin reductase-like flavin-dependent oxidoreductase (luciferase family)